jgi:hypothetical protein
MKKTLPLADVMDIIKGSNIKYMSQYQRFVDDNNLTTLGIPKYPKLAYKSDFPDIDTFLGNPQGTAKKVVRELQSIQANKIKPWTRVMNPGRKVTKNKTVEVEQPVVIPVLASTPSASFASIVKTLHEEYNIPLATLYTLNEEAKKTSLMKVEAINETLTVLVKIAMQKVNPKIKV